MRIYIVIDYDDVYGAFSTLEKAKSYASYLEHEDGDLEKPYYSVVSFELDKELDVWKEIPRFEWAFDGDEEVLSNDNDK